MSAPALDTVVLSEEQEPAAARREGPLALSAAAGSGKTSVLVERFVRAVREDGVSPGRILAITFTERAAGELRGRVRARLLALGAREHARDTEAAFIGTFHGFCARLLRAHPLAAGVDPSFAILEEGLAASLRREAFERALRAFVRDNGEEGVDLLAAYRVDRARAIVGFAHAELRSRGARRPRLPDAAARVRGDHPEDAAAARACALLDSLLAAFDESYERLKRTRQALDFDDLELCAAELLRERTAVRESFSTRFQLMMVDEFQDTNPRQMEILRLLERGNLFTVGDEFQSIYSFRHAQVDLFRERREALAAEGASLALRRNFRSRPELIELVDHVFAERLAGFEPLLAARHGEQDAGGPRVELLLTDTRGWEGQAGAGRTQPWRRAEARALAARVAQLVADDQAQPGEVVVLLRATGDLDVFEQALGERGLRTLAAVGAFWEQQQTLDLLAYLRALANPLDDLAVHSTLASPLFGCSLDGLALLARGARARGVSVWEQASALDSSEQPAPAPADHAAIAAFCELLGAQRALASRSTVAELIEAVLAARGYERHVMALERPRHRLANVRKLLRLAREREAAQGRDLRGFLDHVEQLQAGGTAGEPEAPVEGMIDAVRLMTVHAAKGLEFPVVCVADLGRLPNVQSPDLLLEGERIGLRRVGLDGESEPALDYEQLCEQRRREEAEEEDRILYVAMTRARERLLLSGSVDLARWPARRRSPVSWLVPAISAELPELLAAGAAPERIQLHAGGASVALRVQSAAEAVPAALSSPPGGENQGAIVRPSPPRVAPSSQASRLDLAPRVLSYTALSEHERCGYRFYLERVLGLPENREAARGARRNRGLDARTRGTLIHRLLQAHDFAAATAPGPAQIERAALELGIAVAEGEQRELRGTLAAMLDSDTARRLAVAETIGRELSFSYSLGPEQPLLSGVLDLLALERDGCRLIVDYKSDQLEDDGEPARIVERDYAVQRLVYALAVLRTGAAAVEVLHWFTARPREPVGALYGREDTPALEAELARRTRAIGEGAFAVSASPHRALCQTCPGRGGLCSWGETETMREQPDAAASARSQRPGEPLTLF